MPQMQPGAYHGKLISASMVEVGDKKTPAVEFAIEVLAMWYPDKGEEGEWVYGKDPQLRTIKKYLSPAAEQWTLSDLKKLEFNGSFADMKFRANMYDDGVQLVMYIDDKDYEKWNFSECASKKSQNPEAAQSIVDQFNAKWKQKLADAPASAPGPASAPATPPQSDEPPATPPAENPIPEDDIPF